MYADTHAYFVFILASSKNGAIYTGMTNDLQRRLWEHKNNYNPRSHTAKYNIHRLVYYEVFESPAEAIARENHIKKQHRKYRVRLIEKEKSELVGIISFVFVISKI